MCIRDRGVVIPVAIISTALINEAGQMYAIATTERALPGDCLLYTSDAADERSSVDLGGRRIIKKKKHDHDARVGVIMIKLIKTYTSRC